mgnify:CR=1 FL=1
MTCSVCYSITEKSRVEDSGITVSEKSKLPGGMLNVFSEPRKFKVKSFLPYNKLNKVSTEGTHATKSK